MNESGWFGDGPGSDMGLWYLGLTGTETEQSRGDVERKRLGKRWSPGAPIILQDAGYAVLRGSGEMSDSVVIFDAGPLGMEGFPHHGHADALSVVAYLAGRPILVDPGGYAYRPDPLRAWIRSTLAHNTIAVDGRDQSELYGVVGVGYRARSRMVDWGRSTAGSWVTGRVRHHRGHPSRPLHRRTVALGHKPWPMLLVLDELWTQGGTTAISSWHLHPDIIPTFSEGFWRLGGAQPDCEAFYFHATATAQTCWRSRRGVEGEAPEGWYVPNALEIEPATTLKGATSLAPTGAVSIATAIVSSGGEGSQNADQGTLSLAAGADAPRLRLRWCGSDVALSPGSGLEVVPDREGSR